MFDVKRFVRALKQGYNEDEAKSIIADLAKTDGYIPSVEQALATVEHLYRESRETTLADKITKYIFESVTERVINVRDCDRDLVIVTERDKTNRRQIFHRLVSNEPPLLQPIPNRPGWYRKVEGELVPIDFQTADASKRLPIRLPFGIEQHSLIMPKNIIVVSGSPNAGKTAFLLNIARLNMDHFKTIYFSSEMGDVELKNRVLKFKDVTLSDWKCNFYERDGQYEDVIERDSLNIIDYMEITNDFFLVAEYIRQIFKKLRKGIAVVALQKNPDAKLPRGGIGAIEKARLALNIDFTDDGYRKLTIVKVKNPVVEGKKADGMQFLFDIENGAKLILL